MEPKFQTSFIPKSPITNNSYSPYKPENSFSIIGTLSTLLFLATLVVSGGLFGYERYMYTVISQSQTELDGAKSAFESEDNQKILLVSDQLKSIKTLLNNHTVISPLFDALEKITLPTVKFSSFTFTHDNSSGIVTVTVEGEAQSYASLAQQAQIFRDGQYLKNIEFTDINLSDTGTVRTKLKAEINPDILMYTQKIQSVSVLDNKPTSL